MVFHQAYRRAPSLSLENAKNYSVTAELTASPEDVAAVQEERDEQLRREREARAERAREDARCGGSVSSHYPATTTQARAAGTAPDTAVVMTRTMRLSARPGGQVGLRPEQDLEDVEDAEVPDSRLRAEAKAKAKPRAKRVRFSDSEATPSEREGGAASSGSFGASPDVVGEAAPLRSRP